MSIGSSVRVVLAFGSSQPRHLSFEQLADDGQTRIPVQYERINATYRVTGKHDHLKLFVGAQEVDIVRQAPVKKGGR